MNLLTNTLHRRWSCLLLIIAFMSGFQMFAQSVGASNQLTGRVLDEYDQPIIGAVVKVSGTSIGRSTDADGAFTMKDIPANATLEVSYVGYEKQSIPVNGKNFVLVKLKEANQLLNEVVVVGYGTQKKVNLTGAVGTISAKEINARPVSNVAMALQGADPSMNLKMSSGRSSSGYDLNIRGESSISTSNTPLIMVDGVVTELNMVNPNDIESVSILKDASAASIYGATASKGVILITTKTGSDAAGKASISFNGRFGWSQNTTSTDYMTTGYDQVSLVDKAYYSQYATNFTNYTEEEMQMLYERRNDKTEHPDRPWIVLQDDGSYRYYANFDWYNYLFRKTRPQQEYNLSVRGGNDKVKYYVSGRYNREEGIFNINPDTYDTYSTRAKLDVKIKPWLRYSTNMNFFSSSYKYSGLSTIDTTLMEVDKTLMASWPAKTPEGKAIYAETHANTTINGTPPYLVDNRARHANNQKYIIIGNRFDIDIFKDLVLTVDYSYKYRGRLNKVRNHNLHYSNKQGEEKTIVTGNFKDYYRENHYETNEHNLNVYGTYTHTWNKAHNFTALAGYQYRGARDTYLRLEQLNLLSENLSSFANATGDITRSQTISEWRNSGFFGRVNYDYKNRYLLEVSARYDGTSRFRSDHRWVFVPSASAGWRISEENFWEPIRDVVDNTKIRLSYGKLANQHGVDEYAYLEEINTGGTLNYTLDGTSKLQYAYPSDPKTSYLTWETIATWNIGLDMSFLNSRLNFTGDYFIRDTEGMLAKSYVLPSVFGAKEPKENCADLRTKGWELSLNWNDSFALMGKRFNYTVSASLGDNKTVITKYNNPEKLLTDYYEGMVLGEIWGYRIDGLFASDEEATEYTSKINQDFVNARILSDKVEPYYRAGDLKFRDLDNNNVINKGDDTVYDPGDREIIGNETPRYNYSFRLGADWNGFDLGVFFQGVGKRDWYPSHLSTGFWGPYARAFTSFIPENFMDQCWSEENPGGYLPRFRGYQTFADSQLGVNNDRYLQDASYIRLKNLTVGYTLPVLKKVFTKLRVYFTGENLWYWSPMKKYTKYIDPEAAGGNGNTGMAYNYSRNFSVGVDITF